MCSGLAGAVIRSRPAKPDHGALTAIHFDLRAGQVRAGFRAGEDYRFGRNHTGRLFRWRCA